MNRHPAKLYKAAQVRALDRIAIDGHALPGISLMKRAGEACVNALLARWPDAKSVCILCGKGNNAGDGFIMASLLANRNIDVCVLLAGPEPAPDTDAGMAWELCRSSPARTLNVEIDVESNADKIETLLDADVLVDALLGTGLKGEVRENMARIIRQVNRLAAARQVPVLAVDIPSGLCADTGAIQGAAIKANITVTFIGRKLGCYTNNGPELCGEIVFDSLSVPDAVYADFHAGFHGEKAHETKPANLATLTPSTSSTPSTPSTPSTTSTVTLLDYQHEASRLPTRHRNAHKGAHGHLLIIGGNEGMGGAALMAGEAALMSGAGLVTIATRASNVSAILARRPELMPKAVSKPADLEPLLAKAEVLVLGPGLGRDNWARRLFHFAMSKSAAKPSLKPSFRSGESLPMVLDADALHLLAAMKDAGKLRSDLRNVLLTPHPGEAAHLLGRDDIQDDRLAAVQELRQKYGATALLKGQGTLVACAGSEGDIESGELCLCPYGNPGMSAAGMGDVLSGVAGALMCQGLTQGEAARLGAVVHSKAADELTRRQGERGLLATELLPQIRQLLNPTHGSADHLLEGEAFAIKAFETKTFEKREGQP